MSKITTTLNLMTKAQEIMHMRERERQEKDMSWGCKERQNYEEAVGEE